MILTHDSARYEVGELVAETSTYRIYLCKEIETGVPYLLQVAAQTEYNGGLDRAAYLLRELKQTADLFETEYAKQGSVKTLNYDRLFPALIDSFIAEDQGRRRVNILAFTDVDDVTRMVPLSNLARKDHSRIALPSSAWVMGRVLKLVDFVHDEGIAIRSLSGNNILLEPSQHFAVVFDWSSAQTYQEKVPAAIRKDDIASAAKAVFAAIGGDPHTGDFPYDEDEGRRYVELLWRLASRRESDAKRALDQFYDLVNELWERKFRPLQILPL